MEQANGKTTQLRSYQESFEPATVEVISVIIDDLAKIGEHPTGYRLYTSEIDKCLSVGLLLAAVSVSTSLIELFIRDLAVAANVLSKFDGDMKFKAQVEKSFEEDKTLGFSSMLEALRMTVVAPDDVEALQQFYEATRIPFAHGLVRRLTSSQDTSGEFDNVFSLLSRGIGLEDRLENEAIDEIQFVVRIIKRYRPWLIRRYDS
jgi:hypothetical protein